jgi:hypothetical protein
VADVDDDHPPNWPLVYPTPTPPTDRSGGVMYPLVPVSGFRATGLRHIQLRFTRWDAVTYAPQDLLDVIHYLHAQGAPFDALGIVGDSAHAATGGYHEGRGDLAAHGRLGYDYSVVESRRDARPTDAASAVDFGGATWWRPLTLWLVDQCKAGTPGTEDIREIIYTPDGQTVRRWDRLGVRSTGDDSHLWHTHLSFFRDSEGHRGTFLALLRSYFEPATQAATIDTGDDEEMSTVMIPAGFAFGDGQRKDLLIAGGGLGPVNGGLFGNKRVVLGFGADFTPKAGLLLRVALKPEDDAWVLHQDVVVHAAGNRYTIFLPDGCTKFDIGRVKRTAGDVDLDADGNTTASAETCPAWWDLEFEKR